MPKPVEQELIPLDVDDAFYKIFHSGNCILAENPKSVIKFDKE
jgi:hypothetical protein